MGAPPRILIAEHDVALLQTLAMHLRNEEYEVLCAPDGEDALELARRERPSLMLLDVNLTGGGVGIHDYLSEFPDVAAIPTLYLVARRSAESTGEKRRTGLPSTVTVEKPVVTSELLTKVAGVLAQQEREAGLAAPTRQRVA